MNRYIRIVGRILLSAIFLWSGVGKILHFASTKQFMAAHGMPINRLRLRLRLRG